MSPRGPSWLGHAQRIGGLTWVPAEVARALQEQVDSLRARTARVEREVAPLRDALYRARAEVEELRHARRAVRPEVLEQAQAEARAESAAAATLRRRVALLEERLAERSARVQALDRRVAELVDALEAQDCGPDDRRVAELTADLANLRRRQAEAEALAVRRERTVRLSGLAQVIDALRLSLAANPDRQSAWYQGHASILETARAAVREAGADLVGAVGEPFDPRLHEAVATAPSQALGPDRVLDVAEVGVLLDDGTLARPARVVVSTAAASEE